MLNSCIFSVMKELVLTNISFFSEANGWQWQTIMATFCFSQDFPFHGSEKGFTFAEEMCAE